MNSSDRGTVPVEQADFRIRDDGTSFHLRPISDTGQAWIAKYESGKLTAEGGVAVAPRSIERMIEAIEADGLRFGPHEGEARLDTYPGESDF